MNVVLWGKKYIQGTDKKNDEDGGDSEVDGVWNCKEKKDVSVEEI